ncbi:MAG: Lrp/AsnC ligand binding domain-containing protein [Natronomonas sp.]|uniref:Lrp/AsnC family transcriptional regulator n=1 Tax=Natronomonas sp. TaxID=2184060 RepID=UPI00286FB63A|nr:Lrp/AsnC ligand binding domain-containing protein [Natronomonas sp.]MDR9430821.1 Lrp/AsnC ligand binding domain-containing protein [Natronomonas sp.]
MAEYSEGYHEEVARTLSDIEGVNQVYFTAGETDFTVMAHFASREMVEDLISSYEKIDGVKRTITNFVITTIKDEQIPIRDFEFDMLKQLVNTS